MKQAGSPRRVAAAVLRLVAVLGLVATSSAVASAQYAAFGQNKIQYRDFDWHVLSGEHVDVYYYPAEERIARVALSYAEESYDFLSGKFNHAIDRRIPMIVYASHSDFEQTNILPFVPPEGVLGVTEYMKRRVALPFRGSYSEFRNTLRHEMVHVFQLSVLTQQFEMYPRARRIGVPLWWSEGLAELWSSPQDSRDLMVVRDLTLNSRMPTIDQLNMIYSPVVYPVGAELHHFLAERYGDWRVNLVYQSLWKYNTFDEVLRKVYGRSAKELTDEWQYSLRQRFFPAVSGRKPFQVAGKELADLAVKPVVVPKADTGADVAYLSPRSGYTNIYRTPLNGVGKTRVVVAGERTPEFESLHAFSSRMDAREGVLIFASKYGDRDALFFWDVQKNKAVGRYQFDSLVAILSPAWSTDGRQVAFSGLTPSGVSDLFVFEMSSGILRRLTDDVYEDLDAVWLPGDRTVVFSSDRSPGGDQGSRNLYRVDTESRAISPLTSGMWNDETPRWDTDAGRIIFASDRDGTYNLYSVDTLGNGRRETSLDGGVFDPSPVPNDPRVVVAAFSRLSWSIYSLNPDTSAHVEQFALAPDTAAVAWNWSELNDSTIADITGRRYKRDYSLDFLAGAGQTATATSPAMGGGEIYFSDLLGDHLIATSFGLAEQGGAAEILSNINFNVFYLNQRRRLNWGAGIFRINSLFQENNFEVLYDERSIGAYGALRYPLSRFTRVEGQVRFEHSDRNDYANFRVVGDPVRQGFLVSNFLSLVGDNALWLETGPIDGARWNLTGGVVSDITHGVFENWVGLADVRKYIRTTDQSAFALRGLGYISEGTRERAISLGGPWLMRGYPRFMVNGARAWLFNSEWRFPITHFVTLGFPFGAVRFPQVQGAFFGDIGQAWDDVDGNDFAAEFFRDQKRRILGSYGIGFRMGLVPGLVLRVDIAERFAIESNTTFENIYGTGRHVDFFFGYNY